MRRFLGGVVVAALLGIGLVLGALFLGLSPGASWPGADPEDRPLTALPQTALPQTALPQAGPLRITAFGTSLTARGDWPVALARALTTCLGRPVTVQRHAKPGAGSAWARGAVAAVAATRPDLVLMEFSINDADIRDGISLSASRDNHRAVLADLGQRLPGARVLLMTMSPAHGLRGIARPRLGAYYRIYHDLAAPPGTSDRGASDPGASDRGGPYPGLIDFTPRWRAMPAWRRALPDGLHPGAAEARAVMLPPLTGMIARAAGGHCGD